MLPHPASRKIARPQSFSAKLLLRRLTPAWDGGMVPIVAPSCEGKDKRKGKTLSWREAKLSLAHAQGSRTPVYAGGIEGGAQEAGRRLLCCAVRAGYGANSRVHAVGDGAPWIVGQVEEQFGDQGRYLIDFYHVCEYLAAASEAIAPDPAARSAFLETQKDALKSGRLDAVLRALAGYCEPPEVDDEHAPVRTCHRYLSARANQLNYRQALAEGLPIGSGEPSPNPAPLSPMTNNPQKSLPRSA